jgi:hypothetical protein
LRLDEIQQKGIRSEYFYEPVQDTIGARDIYSDIRNQIVYSYVYNGDEEYAQSSDIYLVVGNRDGERAYGFIADNGGSSWSIDDKIYHDVDNIDQRTEDLLQL